LPASINGVLYRNGPSVFRSGDGAYLHAFDGDGAITAVRIGAGEATGAVRVVETRWLRAERAANRQLYRSYAQLGRGWRRWFTLPKNTANISVMPHGTQLLALFEAGMPIAVDAESLECKGVTDLGGAVGPTFSAHPHTVSGATLNFGVRYGMRFSLDLYELSGEAKRIGRVPLRFPTIIHDFIPTERYCIFFCPPLRVRVARLLSGTGSFNENLVWQPEHGTEILVIPRDNPKAAVRFEVPAFFQWHFVNAWEKGEDSLTVDFIRYPDFATNEWFGRAPWEIKPVAPSAYVRSHIDLKRQTFESQVVADITCEFPAIEPTQAGQEHTDAWALTWTPRAVATGGSPDLSHIDPRSGEVRPADLGSNVFPSEPSIVSGPEGTFVLSLVYDGTSDRSFVAVLDTQRWQEGAVAKLWFDHPIPFPYHGAFKSA
jgi:all-trans-8'-apo-beta-carotenal 15,15'-oxygenase